MQALHRGARRRRRNVDRGLSRNVSVEDVGQDCLKRALARISKSAAGAFERNRSRHHRTPLKRLGEPFRPASRHEGERTSLPVRRRPTRAAESYVCRRDMSAVHCQRVLPKRAAARGRRDSVRARRSRGRVRSGAPGRELALEDLDRRGSRIGKKHGNAANAIRGRASSICRAAGSY